MTVRRFSVGLATVALAATGALAAAPAHAAPARVTAPAAVLCLGPAAGAPAVKRAPDTSPVGRAVRERVEAQLAAARATTPAKAGVLPGGRTADLPVFRVKVQIHVIHGSHRGERKIGRKAARRKVFDVLKNAYNGGESPNSVPMGIDFRLKRITISKNDRWYHAEMMSRADRQMRNRLHRGRANTLNIYVNKPRPVGGGLVLGFSRFPWQYARHKSLDGVDINERSLPGGTAWGYNLGDSVVHETGHWLGLWHTFQNGCDAYNDGVTDTPAERDSRGNFNCADVNNLCNPGDLATMADPAYNFMEYTKDACMQMFTLGQRERVAQMFQRFRYGR